jgi:endogenous inhibitor of DNA gyrase (YacG/DUF329 family)
MNAKPCEAAHIQTNTRSHKENLMYQIACIECGNIFQSPNSKRKCCSRACADMVGTRQRSRKVSCTCEVCGKTEMRSPSHVHHRYCSLECKGIASRLPLNRCETCLKDFQPESSRQRFCSNECSSASRRISSDRTCPVCNKTFHRRGGRVPNYCSVECMAIGYTTRHIEEKPCAYCGNVFLPTDIRSNFCSKSCLAKAGKIHKVKLITMTCAYCGKTEPRKTGEKRKYCSDECKKNAKRKRNTLYKFTYSQKTTIKTRDGFRCILCGSDFKLEVDHLLAIALGGLNTIENGRTLCRDCHKEKTANDKKRIRAWRKA